MMGGNQVSEMGATNFKASFHVFIGFLYALQSFLFAPKFTWYFTFNAVFRRLNENGYMDLWIWILIWIYRYRYEYYCTPKNNDYIPFSLITFSFRRIILCQDIVDTWRKQRNASVHFINQFVIYLLKINGNWQHCTF